MLDNKGFDLWADGYDKSVGLSDDDGTNPFAGYRQILNEIYNRVLTHKGKSVLDIGFGTGTHTARLYQGDFSQGLVEELKQNRYDAIIATYSLHHLTDAQKVRFLDSIIPLLNNGGCIYIGDVAFDSRKELEENKALIGDKWDNEEIYFVVDEMKKVFPQMKFERFSFCAGLFSIILSIR